MSTSKTVGDILDIIVDLPKSPPTPKSPTVSFYVGYPETPPRTPVDGSPDYKLLTP